MCDPGSPLDPTDSHCVLETSGDACASNDDCDEDVIDVAKYNAIGVIGNENNDGDNVLCLGGEPGEECPNGAEVRCLPAGLDRQPLRGRRAEPRRGPTGLGRYDVDDRAVHAGLRDARRRRRSRSSSTSGTSTRQPSRAGTRVTCWDELNLSESGPGGVRLQRPGHLVRPVAAAFVRGRRPRAS